MIAGSKYGVALSLLILSALGIPMRAQAGDPGTAVVVQIRPADSPQAQNDMSERAMAESPASSVSTQPTIPECDGQTDPTGVVTRLLNRVMGHTLPEDVRLCPPPSGGDTAPDIANR